MIKLNEIFIGKENNLTFIRTLAAVAVIVYNYIKKGK